MTSPVYVADIEVRHVFRLRTISDNNERKLLLIVDNLNSLICCSSIVLDVCRVSVQDGVSIGFCQRHTGKYSKVVFRTGKFASS